MNKPTGTPEAATEKQSDSISAEIRRHLSDRFGSEFFGTLAFAWVISNWRFIAILLFASHLTIEDRISEVLTNYKGWWPMLILPLLLAGGYVILSPFVAGACAEPKKLAEIFFKNRDLAYQRALKRKERELKEAAAEEWVFSRPEEVREFAAQLNKREAEVEILEQVLARERRDFEALVKEFESHKSVTEFGLQMRERVIKNSENIVKTSGVQAVLTSFLNSKKVLQFWSELTPPSDRDRFRELFDLDPTTRAEIAESLSKSRQHKR